MYKPFLSILVGCNAQKSTKIPCIYRSFEGYGTIWTRYELTAFFTRSIYTILYNNVVDTIHLY